MRSTTTTTVVDATRPDARWDEFVAAHPEGDLVQSTAWAATKASLGQLTRLSVRSRADGSIEAGALLVASRVAPGARVGYVARGPIVDARVDEPGPVFASVVEAVLRDARAHACRIVIVQPPGTPGPCDVALDGMGFATGAPAVSPEATIRLDLHRSDAELLAAMSSMRRRNIRKIVANPFEIEESGDVELFHRLHEASARRQGFEPRSLEYLRAQRDALAPGRNVVILVARREGAPVAAIWLTVFGGTATYRLPGWSSTATGGANANEALHWAAVHLARGRGCHTYDLGGFDAGVARRLLAGEAVDAAFRHTAGYFKLGFNPEPVLLAPAQWIVTSRLARPLVGPLVARALASDRGRALANRFRNG